ncbi:uncharacterized protein LOC108290308 [Cebus imitator]|uniref:uncharacterized protein LOC108290308 n=1 Tax=Cebus imitator TaxID=2715852 RepID=UPI0018979432|nr:uncharacterized protein LOC108290308 [Cebus imitator]
MTVPRETMTSLHSTPPGGGDHIKEMPESLLHDGGGWCRAGTQVLGDASPKSTTKANFILRISSDIAMGRWDFLAELGKLTVWIHQGQHVVCSNRAPEQDWRRSEKDQWERLAESRWQRAELCGCLRAALESLSEQIQVLQRRESKLGLGWALKQKQAVCSLAHLEAERTQGQAEWRRPNQDIEDNPLQVQEAPVPLRKELEAQDSHPRLREEMAQHWKAPWHQVAVALKFQEEELQRLQRQSGTWPPQTGSRRGYIPRA